jgi:hypothetical protein
MLIVLRISFTAGLHRLRRRSEHCPACSHEATYPALPYDDPLSLGLSAECSTDIFSHHSGAGSYLLRPPAAFDLIHHTQWHLLCDCRALSAPPLLCGHPPSMASAPTPPARLRCAPSKPICKAKADSPKTVAEGDVRRQNTRRDREDQEAPQVRPKALPAPRHQLTTSQGARQQGCWRGHA